MRYADRRDEDKFLRMQVAGCELFKNSFTFSDLIDGIQKNEPPLQLAVDDGVEVLEDSNLDEILRVLPHVRHIFEKPRSFIRTTEEKVSIERAKHINRKAINVLSRDSKDWYTRTPTSIEPRVITADVNEETVDIYENRFVCSLIDRISELMTQSRHAYDTEYKNADEQMRINEMEEMGYLRGENSSFCREILHVPVSYSDNSYVQDLEKILIKLDDISKQLRLIRNSDVYRELKNRKKVTNPIQKTNLLIFDYNYNQAYRLWNYLNMHHLEERNKLEYEEISEDELQRNYVLYCFLCLCAAFHDLGFEERSDSRFEFDVNGLHSDDDMQMFRDIDGEEFKVSISGQNIMIAHRIARKEEIVEKKGIKLKTHRIAENIKEWEHIAICPDYRDLEKENGDKVDEYTKDILCEFMEVQDPRNPVLRFSAMSFNVGRYSGNSIPQYVYNRFYSMGDHIDPSEEHVLKWMDHRTGMLLISPSSLQYNFLHLEKLLNYQIVRLKLSSAFRGSQLKQCPVCFNERIECLDGENYRCKNCMRSFSVTYCKECDPENKHPILWVKYENELFMKKSSIMKLFKRPHRQLLSTLERMMGPCTTTAFTVEKKDESYKLKTICPRCGKVLGTKN